MAKLKPFLILLGALGVLAVSLSCSTTRTIIVREGEPVQLAEPVRARVYVNVNGVKERSDTRVEIPEGWWALPDPER